MKATIVMLEEKVATLNELLQQNLSRKDYNLTNQKRNYYISKLVEMDENNLTTINI